jgi:hypothetical protein
MDSQEVQRSFFTPFAPVGPVRSIAAHPTRHSPRMVVVRRGMPSCECGVTKVPA